MIKILIAEYKKQICESLSQNLLLLGVIGISATSYEQIIPILKSNEINYLIIDVDNHIIQAEKVFNFIKDNNLNKIKIIIHTVQTQAGILSIYKNIYISGYLFKPYKEKTAILIINSLIKKLENRIEKRKHIRIKPDLNDLLRVHFRIPGKNKLITCKVIDLSLGGVALQLYQNIPDPELKIGKKIFDMTLTMRNEQIHLQGIVTKKKSQFCSIKINFKLNKDVKKVSQYIINQLNTNINFNTTDKKN